MKNKRLPGSLFGLLVRNYLLFTLTLLAIAGGVFCLWNASVSRLYRFTDWDALMGDPALYAEDYDSLRPYLSGRGDAFAIYDGAGTLLYASADGFDAACTPEELACVPLWSSNTGVDAFEQTGEDGAIRRLVVRYTYQQDGQTMDVMVLDQDYQVLYGGLEPGKDAYTPGEYQYLTGRRFPGGSLFRDTFYATDGGARTLLLLERSLSDPSADQLYRSSWRIWLLSIPLYLLSAGLFIWWMGCKIGRPLRRLNDAVNAQAEGRTVRVGDCGGTREIRSIGESFDRFSDRLAESEAERQRLDQGRQKLIADISHDLKTPITVIAGYIDAICDGKVPPPEQERYLRAIQNRAEALTELVNTFHEYSKVEHPEFVLHPEHSDVCEFLRAYLAGKYNEIDLAGFTLEISIPEQPLFCALDQPQFRRVLDNLLSNALRHNRLGTRLCFALSCTDTAAVLRVADNGTGIPPDRARHIFEPFTVGSDARSGKGSGLGLSITRRIMEKHGGSISLAARPTPGWSTEFILKLPLDSSR